MFMGGEQEVLRSGREGGEGGGGGGVPRGRCIPYSGAAWSILCQCTLLLLQKFTDRTLKGHFCTNFTMGFLSHSFFGF